MMRSIVALGVGGLLSPCALPCRRKTPFWDRRTATASTPILPAIMRGPIELLTSAIDGGSRDPRCYYFRGLAYTKLGRPQDAESDFQQGAKLETADLNKTYSVAKSLERVQGPARLDLEQYRQAARMAAFQQQEKLQHDRYQQMNLQERRALEEQAGPAPAKSGGAEPPAPPPAGDPFSTPATGTPDKPVALPDKAQPPPAAEKPAEEKKAGEAAPKATGDNAADPFADKTEKAEKDDKTEKAEKDDAEVPPNRPRAAKGARSAGRKACRRKGRQQVDRSGRSVRRLSGVRVGQALRA